MFSKLNYLAKFTIAQNVQLCIRRISMSNVLRKHDKNVQSNDVSDDIDEINRDDKEYQEIASEYFSSLEQHNCLIIHPYVKWGPKKVRDTDPQKQIQEAEALVRTLEPWTVHSSIKVPLEQLDKKQIFGKGTLEKLKTTVHSDPRITSIFINMSTLKNMQLEELQRIFRVPIFDRYKIVMEILRLHAISKHAKLQVALAEIPYIRTRLHKDDSAIASADLETRKLMLHSREQKIKNAIDKLRSQRRLLRNRRQQIDYPVIAVVGYTNCGKTSIIKALTGEEKMQPKNQLFATLDVTMHAGFLPSKLEVLYVDTVGFISNIPTNLIECFVATLEDAMYADVILHVEDISNEDLIHQRNHVISTLKTLADQTGAHQLLNKMITVGNKCDVAQNVPGETLPVSAKTGRGLEMLLQLLDEAVLSNTNRKCLTIRVPSGGDEMRWLYKNSAVTSVDVHEDDSQLQNMSVIITHAKLEQFKHIFLKNRK